MNEPMTSAERVDAAMGFRQPDRVPFVLPAHMHAARHLGLSIRDCLETPRHIVAAQLHLREWLGNDMVSGAPPAAFEVEAWGGTIAFDESGPPVAGPPPIRPQDIARLQPPRLEDSPRLLRALEAITELRARVGNAVPVVGAVVSPFSLPVLQLGFETYLEVMEERPLDFERLMEVNIAYCLAWARAQVRAGATALAYADPVASTDVVPLETARQKALAVARRVLPDIGVPFIYSLASGRSLPLVDDLVGLGATAVGVSAQEDLGEALERCWGRIAVVGNLNALAMCGWSTADAESAALLALWAAGTDGGWILADNHGEIPFPVPDDVLSTIAETVKSHGRATSS
jgi:uroporphyrinogen decarboxylase